MAKCFNAQDITELHNSFLKVRRGSESALCAPKHEDNRGLQTLRRTLHLCPSLREKASRVCGGRSPPIRPGLAESRPYVRGLLARHPYLLFCPRDRSRSRASARCVSRYGRTQELCCCTPNSRSLPDVPGDRSLPVRVTVIARGGRSPAECPRSFEAIGCGFEA